MEFKILGTLEVVDGTLSRTPTAPKIRQVLATLLVRANHFVSVEALIDEVWGENPPVRALTTIQTYIHHLRKEFLKAPDSVSSARLVVLPSDSCADSYQSQTENAIQADDDQDTDLIHGQEPRHEPVL